MNKDNIAGTATSTTDAAQVLFSLALNSFEEVQGSWEATIPIVQGAGGAVTNAENFNAYLLWDLLTQLEELVKDKLPACGEKYANTIRHLAERVVGDYSLTIGSSVALMEWGDLELPEGFELVTLDALWADTYKDKERYQARRRALFGSSNGGNGEEQKTDA